MIFGDDFQSKDEAKIGDLEGSGQQEPDWQTIRRRGSIRTEQGQSIDEVSLRDSDSSSVNITFFDSLCRSVGRRKRQRMMDLNKTDRRERHEHTEEDKKTEGGTEHDEGKGGNDLEHDICVITWSVNKSSAQFDFSVAQVNVVMFQETQKLATRWHGGSLGMDFAERTEGWQVSNCCQKKEHEPSETFSQKYKMSSYGSGKYLISVDVFVTHLEW